MLLTVLAAWPVCAVLVAVAFAAIGRSGLREDQAMEHLQSAGVSAQSPVLSEQSADLSARSPGVSAQSPDLWARVELVGA